MSLLSSSFGILFSSADMYMLWWVNGWVVGLRGAMPGEGPPLFTLCGNPFGVMTGCRPVCYSLATSIVESCAAARPLKGFVPPFAQRTFIIKTRVVLAPPLVLLAGWLSCPAVLCR